MSENKQSIYDSISDVQESIEKREQRQPPVRRKWSQNLSRFRPGLMLVVLAFLMIFKVASVDEEKRVIADDFRLAAESLFLEADASVSDYFNFYGKLPDILPITELAPYVNYEKLSEFDYALELNYIPYNQRFEREIGIDIYPTDVRDFFNSVIR